MQFKDVVQLASREQRVPFPQNVKNSINKHNFNIFM